MSGLLKKKIQLILQALDLLKMVILFVLYTRKLIDVFIHMIFALLPTIKSINTKSGIYYICVFHVCALHILIFFLKTSKALMVTKDLKEMIMIIGVLKSLVMALTLLLEIVFGLVVLNSD